VIAAASLAAFAVVQEPSPGPAASQGPDRTPSSTAPPPPGLNAQPPGLAPSLWTSAAAPGQPERREHDEDGDGRMERIEVSREGKVAEVQVDGDRDGRIDRWQRWENGRLIAEDLDTDRDGKADRTVRYDPRGKVLALEPIAPR